MDTEQWVGKLPDNVVDYLKGGLGTPPGGFPSLFAHMFSKQGRQALQREQACPWSLMISNRPPRTCPRVRRGLPHRREGRHPEALYPSVCRLHGAPTGVRRRRALTYSCFLASERSDEVEFGTATAAPGRPTQIHLELDDKTCSRRVVFS